MSLCLVGKKRRVDCSTTTLPASQRQRSAGPESVEEQRSSTDAEAVPVASTSGRVQRRKRGHNQDDAVAQQGASADAEAMPVASTTCQVQRRKRHNDQNATAENLSKTLKSKSVLLAEIPRCGKILKIVLVNFMCHEHLCVELYKRVNFLIGSNGSGKSAILAALVVGLGARARVTNRSGALSKLIKTGESTSKIEITLSNEGPDAYEPEIYGNQITVLRTIGHSRSTYRIKNAQGNVVSEKLDDLHIILMLHNIQVDNPVFVMNQDSAREFLKEMDPKKNYTLFLKATQLELVQETLKKCHIEFQDQIERLKDIKQKLHLNQQKIDEGKGKLQQLLSFAQAKNELYQKEVEYAWLLVIKAEQQLKETQQEISNLEVKRSTMAEVSKRKNNIETGYNQEMIELKNRASEKRAAYNAANAKCHSINEQLTRELISCQEFEGSVNSVKNRITRLETQIAELRRNIDERSNNMGIAELRRHNDDTLRELRKRHKETTAMIESAKRDYNIFTCDKIQKEDQRNAVRERVSQLNASIATRRAEIANLQGNAENCLSIYGEDLRLLFTEIERHQKAGKFSEQPRGPIGRYIEVPNIKYRDMVENQIGGLLDAFIVNSKQDRLLLEEIRKQKCPHYYPTVITTKFHNQVYDVSKGCVRPPSGTQLLLDVMRCHDAVTMNCLIDQLEIETILVSDTKDIAERFTMHQEQVPHNLKKIVVLQPSMEYFPDPKFRMYSLRVQPARYIQVNVDDRIRQLKVDVNDMSKQIQKLNEEVVALEPQLRDIEQRLNEKKTLLKRHNEICLELEQRIDELKNFEYPDSNEIEILQNELGENQRQLETLQQKLAAKETTYSAVKTKKQRIECELNEEKSKMSSILKEMDKIESMEHEVQMKMRSLAGQSEQCEAKMIKISEQLQELELRKEKQEKSIAMATKNAQKRGERCDVTRDEEDILQDIEIRKNNLRLGAQLTDDPNEVRQQINSMEISISRDRCTYQTLKLVVQQLRQSLVMRVKFMERFKRHMVMMLQYSFGQVLSMRRFTGNIQADHEQHTLTVSVVPRDNSIRDAVSSTRSLSGGERSYATVAFLIALWSCVDHPFFFLDEYDVFTDDVNREYMTRLLLYEGEKRRNRQYTFLTPQDMSLQSHDYVRIHRLAEPNRR